MNVQMQIGAHLSALFTKHGTAWTMSNNAIVDKNDMTKAKMTVDSDVIVHDALMLWLMLFWRHSFAFDSNLLILHSLTLSYANESLPFDGHFNAIYGLRPTGFLSSSYSFFFQTTAHLS